MIWSTEGFLTYHPSSKGLVMLHFIKTTAWAMGVLKILEKPLLGEGGVRNVYFGMLVRITNRFHFIFYLSRVLLDERLIH